MPDEKPSRESRRAMQRRLKRPPGRPRNPALEFRFEPTKADRELVKLLAGYALPHDRIVKAIRNPHTRRPIGIGTLYKHFADELDAGATEVDALCTEMLTKRLREGNVTALIWVTKNRWGWKDVVEQQAGARSIYQFRSRAARSWRSNWRNTACRRSISVTTSLCSTIWSRGSSSTTARPRTDASTSRLSAYCAMPLNCPRR